jgi:hypothetical protein
METVWIYVGLFATPTAEKWLADIDPHGTIFEYDVLGWAYFKPARLRRPIGERRTGANGGEEVVS